MALLSLILAHFIADFYLQKDRMANNKEKYLRLHMMHHAIFLLIALLFIWGRNNQYHGFFVHVLFPLILILITHYLIDLMKIKMEKSQRVKELLGSYYDLKLFVSDQILHLIVLMIIGHLFFSLSFRLVFENIIASFQSSVALSPTDKVLFLAIIIIAVTSISGHIIAKTLGNPSINITTFEGKLTFKSESLDDRSGKLRELNRGVSEEYHYLLLNNRYNRGRTIGYIERLLVLILTYYAAYPAIAFIITAKSIARFKQMEDRDFAEYFLLGTLLSMLFGIVLGLVVRMVLSG
ncbi:DUF3307 domain-containing protein [Oceanobacillus sp. 143]|uniref:DUF3307 domain-containing protein n=1 Tax=Oceanobacillus zhaokaii TaxID=2052660 RepID=A0A345PJX0_9BACI|nr:DUF3307 domain-containing protein [Oceanobacillus zhaokaii]AXI10300.1 DUF3307 domain-containing protein [Oceanobacillus zhaokaii]QGS69353.1 DUF3307 domain-containing protein [Oceanobacillus sp. 143]